MTATATKRDYACPKCRRHYRLTYGSDYFCNCKQKEKRRLSDPMYDAFDRERKGIRAVTNPLGAGDAFYTKLDLLPELNSLFGLERSL